MNTIFIILSLFTITFLIIFIYSKKRNKIISQFCVSDSDCEKGYKCIVNPEYENLNKQCFPVSQKFCEITPATNLQSCKIGDENACSECLNTPSYTCIDVKKDKPYIFKQGNKNINIPNSENGFGWCLPNMENRDITCNQFTSDYVLTQTQDGGFEWACHCKYPNLFDHANGPESSCDMVRACQNGTFVVPRPDNKKCSTDSECGNDNCLPALTEICGYSNSNAPIAKIDCSKPNSNCYCHTKWEGKVSTESNPLLGRCICNNDLQFQCLKQASDLIQMNCVKGQCQGYEIDENANNCNANNCSGGDKCICCKCPSGFIRCPDDIFNNPGLINYCKQTGATCIPDPCKTLEAPNGKWDPVKRQCVCSDANTIPYSDDQSPVGQICIDLCGKHNPCGNRGTCYVPNGSLNALCCDCVAPFTNDGDNTCMCNVNTGGKRGGDLCKHDSECASGKCNGTWVDGTFVGSCSYDKVITSPCGSTCTVTNNDKPTSQTCADGQTQCMSSETCCKDNKGGYYCSTATNATCCEDNIHACPPTYPTCDIKKGQCFSLDGTKSIPFG